MTRFSGGGNHCVDKRSLADTEGTAASDPDPVIRVIIAEWQLMAKATPQPQGCRKTASHADNVHFEAICFALTEIELPLSGAPTIALQ
jgi:hypothetical protein